MHIYTHTHTHHHLTIFLSLVLFQEEMRLARLMKTAFNCVAFALGGVIIILGIGYLIKQRGVAAAILILLQVLTVITIPSLQPVIGILATL